jgi:hypothetical protein
MTLLQIHNGDKRRQRDAKAAKELEGKVADLESKVAAQSRQLGEATAQLTKVRLRLRCFDQHPVDAARARCTAARSAVQRVLIRMIILSMKQNCTSIATMTHPFCSAQTSSAAPRPSLMPQARMLPRRLRH